MLFSKKMLTVFITLILLFVIHTQSQSQTTNTLQKQTNTPIANEYDLKASLIFKFIEYIEWNSPVPTDSVRIAIVGNSGIAGSLKAAAKQKNIQNKPVALYFYSNLTDLALSAMEKRKIQLIFVSKIAAPSTVRKISTAPIGKSALIVGERDGFARDGGHLNFINQNEKIRFETNPSSFSNCNFKLSYQLLRLAQIVS